MHSDEQKAGFVYPIMAITIASYLQMEDHVQRCLGKREMPRVKSRTLFTRDQANCCTARVCLNTDFSLELCPSGLPHSDGPRFYFSCLFLHGQDSSLPEFPDFSHFLRKPSFCGTREVRASSKIPGTGQKAVSPGF